MLGLTESELQDLDAKRKEELFVETRQKYFDAGADFVIDQINDLPMLLTSIRG
jgi:hypothetical protein